MQKKISNLNAGTYVYGIHEGATSYAHGFKNAELADFERVEPFFKNLGYTKKSRYKLGNNIFEEYYFNDDYALVSFYPSGKEIRIVTESSSSFLGRTDLTLTAQTESSITQIDLEDFGISYAIKLSDGRFIVIDGGWEFEPDADKLMKCLRQGSPYEKPVIATWIFTHAHIDHYRCFMAFMKKYADDVTIQSFLYNFFDPDDTDPLLQTVFSRENAEFPHIIRFEETVRSVNAPVYRAHTGQIYDISNAHLEIISSPDDVFYEPIDEINKMSLIIKMTLEGQTVLFCGDAYFRQARSGRLWGDYLKSDILQVPHHGFCGGEIEEYDLIDPQVCLWPVFENDCYERINIYRDHSYHLMYNLNVKEAFAGGNGNIVLKMPYTPKSNGRKIYMDTIEKYQKSIGATSWFFDGVCDGNSTFTFITNVLSESGKHEVYADLYFAKSSNFVSDVKIELSPYCVNKKDILNPEDADPHAIFFDRGTLSVKGRPEGEPFAVRFRSKYPFIVKWTEPDIYHA